MRRINLSTTINPDHLFVLVFWPAVAKSAAAFEEASVQGDKEALEDADNVVRTPVHQFPASTNHERAVVRCREGGKITEDKRHRRACCAARPKRPPWRGARLYVAPLVLACSRAARSPASRLPTCLAAGLNATRNRPAAAHRSAALSLVWAEDPRRRLSGWIAHIWTSSARSILNQACFASREPKARFLIDGTRRTDAPASLSLSGPGELPPVACPASASVTDQPLSGIASDLRLHYPVNTLVARSLTQPGRSGRSRRGSPLSSLSDSCRYHSDCLEKRRRRRSFGALGLRSATIPPQRTASRMRRRSARWGRGSRTHVRDHCDSSTGGGGGARAGRASRTRVATTATPRQAAAAAQPALVRLSGCSRDSQRPAR